MCGALWVVRDQTTLEGQVSVALAVAVVVSPNTHPYDLLVLIPALVFVAALSVASGLAYGFSQWLGFVDAVGLPNHTMGFMVNWMGLAWKVAPGSPLIRRHERLEAARSSLVVNAGDAP